MNVLAFKNLGTSAGVWGQLCMCMNVPTKKLPTSPEENKHEVYAMSPEGDLVGTSNFATEN